MLEELVKMSNKYGGDSELVLAGGGNTSWKNYSELYVKGSGTQLATITADGFVGMSRKKISAMFEKEYSDNDDTREAMVLEDMMGSRLIADNRRPSVEAALHHLISYKLVLHVHPAMVNGITCGVDGKKIADELFGNNYIWIPICKPGYTLSVLCKNKLDEYLKKHGLDCNMILLQNHGIFWGANSLEEMENLVTSTLDTIKTRIAIKYDFSNVNYCEQNVEVIKNKLSEISSKSNIEFIINKTVADIVKDDTKLNWIKKPFTPDHIVYCKAKFLFVESDNIEKGYQEFVALNGYVPKIVVVKNIGVFALCDTKKDLVTTSSLFLDAVKIALYAQNFGGVLPMTDELIDFITNWEIESYRQKQI